MAGATVVARVTDNVSGLRLKVATDAGFTSPVYGTAVASSGGIAKMTITGLAADTLHYYRVQKDGVDISTLTGQFRTKPAASFKCCFASCSQTGSNHAVFDSIRNESPHFFIHMGDRHYNDVADASDAAQREGHERALAQSRQHQLFREVCTYYVWDDHDYGPNDSDGTFTGKNNARRVFRERVPHVTLEQNGEADPIYYSFDVGRVRFIVTDLRSEASAKGATDDASKTMLGATQKTWFKDLIENSAGFLLVWVCSRVFHATTSAGHDSWGGFNTERVELADHIKTHASGRFVILTGDRHQAGIDDGTNCDYATTGDPLPICMAAPLDQSTNTHGGATFSGGVSSGNGQYGIMEITDGGGASITVDWTLKNSGGTTLDTESFVVAL